jgi:hypothetical protein
VPVAVGKLRSLRYEEASDANPGTANARKPSLYDRLGGVYNIATVVDTRLAVHRLISSSIPYPCTSWSWARRCNPASQWKVLHR